MPSREVNSEQLNPYANAMKQLENMTQLIKLDPDVHEMLRMPKRILSVSVVVRWDNYLD